MSITVNLKTYEKDTERSPDIIRYQGPAHSLTVNDYLDAKRTAPKPTATFAGVGKASFKLTRTATDGTDPIAGANALLEISSNIPVGMATSEIAALIADAAAWLATASATDLFEKHDINQ